MFYSVYCQGIELQKNLSFQEYEILSCFQCYIRMIDNLSSPH